MAIANAFCISLRSTISDAADSGVFSTLPPQFTASKLQSSAVLHSFSSSGGFVYRRKTYTVSCTLDGVDSLPPALMKALKDLGLDVVKGTVTTQDAVKKTKILITRLDTGRKVEDPDLLENIRLTIINNLMKYHPESSERLAMGEAFGIKAPEKKPDVDVATHIHVKDDGPKRSMLYVETADRSGLLMEIVKIMADINIHVESAEIDTEGLIAKDKFYVSYGGAALTKSLSQVLVNCLRYHLRRPETDEESY
ncbi:ACT domain-containing protein ACR12 isoform X2 [Capsicum annuum]|uniref:ACT domain-containing protein ACR12 isoform X2 n=1 Tax=Capsicum annuum TaxID=4072 RepID=UPI0007BF4A6F|nr:ACT domain-containing protein ACR12 isoform X2 [Capsicum annuum]